MHMRSARQPEMCVNTTIKLCKLYIGVRNLIMHYINVMTSDVCFLVDNVTMSASDNANLETPIICLAARLAQAKAHCDCWQLEHRPQYDYWRSNTVELLRQLRCTAIEEDGAVFRASDAVTQGLHCVIEICCRCSMSCQWLPVSDLQTTAAELLLVGMRSRFAVPDRVLWLMKELFDLARPVIRLCDVVPLLRHDRDVIRTLAVELVVEVEQFSDDFDSQLSSACLALARGVKRAMALGCDNAHRFFDALERLVYQPDCDHPRELDIDVISAFRREAVLTLAARVVDDRSTNNERAATSALKFLLHVFVAGRASRDAMTLLLRHDGRQVLCSIFAGVDQYIYLFGFQSYEIHLFGALAMALAAYVRDAVCSIRVRPMAERVLDMLRRDLFMDAEFLAGNPPVWSMLDEARGVLTEACQRLDVPHATSRGL